MLVLVLILLLLLSSFGVLYWWLDRRQRLANAREGTPNPRGKRPMLDGSEPIVPDGLVVHDRVFLQGCLSQLALPYLCEGERLLLASDTRSGDLLLKNHRRLTVGRVKPDNPAYPTVAERLARGEVINLWISEWGATRDFLGEVAVELYDSPDAVPADLPEHLSKIHLQSSVVFFPTHDLVTTAEFYSRVLGFGVRHQTSASIIVDTGYGYLGFVNYGDDQPLATGCCISLNCPNRAAVDSAYSVLRRGNIILQAPTKHPVFPVYSFFMNDPNGYTLEIQVIE